MCELIGSFFNQLCYVRFGRGVKVQTIRLQKNKNKKPASLTEYCKVSHDIPDVVLNGLIFLNNVLIYLLSN